MFIKSLETLGTQTEIGTATGASALFQQNLLQLEQDATSNPNAAVQFLQSLPPSQQSALMQALEQQDPQAAASVNAAFAQQGLPLLGQAPAPTTNNISAMIQLAQNLGKMLGVSGTHQQLPTAQTGPTDGYSPFTTMTA